MPAASFDIPFTGALFAQSVVSRGITIAITGMLIVAIALLLIFAFISALPHILAIVGKYFPEVEDPHGRSSTTQSHPESQVADDEAVMAAIGFVLHSRLQNKG
jgi:Na+-transporting methylmalonyl-CoA/oxaloacetate decarboxylase gamma subunit